jgi:hypothetical protein
VLHDVSVQEETRISHCCHGRLGASP